MASSLEVASRVAVCRLNRGPARAGVLDKLDHRRWRLDQLDHRGCGSTTGDVGRDGVRFES
jgi:hypothetical protein